MQVTWDDNGLLEAHERYALEGAHITDEMTPDEIRESLANSALVSRGTVHRRGDYLVLVTYDGGERIIGELLRGGSHLEELPDVLSTKAAERADQEASDALAHPAVVDALEAIHARLDAIVEYIGRQHKEGAS